jgi:hypothetical protein
MIYVNSIAEEVEEAKEEFEKGKKKAYIKVLNEIMK